MLRSPGSAVPPADKLMSHSSIGLLGLGTYVPEQVMTNEDWARRINTSDEWITARTGIKRRRIAAEDQSTVDLAVAAAREALRDAGLDVQDIDEIIVATDTPEVFIPDTAAYVQERLGAREVAAYDLAGSGCAGFLLALDVARCRVAAEPRLVLVIGVELITRLMNWEDRNTCVLFGDAAGAAVIGVEPALAEIVAAVAGTDGSRADILALEAGGTRVPFDLAAAEAGLHRQIVMHGRKIFKEAVTRMAAASVAVLEKAGATLDDVSLVVPHQANLRILNAVAKALDLPPGKLYVNIQEFGNTGSASVPLALHDARREGLIQPGDLVLLTSFGAGFHWAATLLRFR